MSPHAEIDPRLAAAVESEGYSVVDDAVSGELVAELKDTLGALSGPGVHDRGGVYAARCLFSRSPGARRVLEAPGVRAIADAVLGRNALSVRSLFLKRTPRTNWKVPWHQDATVAVEERAAVTGFGPWSIKSGVHHAMAPPGVLASMLTLRVHLDACAESDGALLLIPGSHQYGRLPVDSIPEFVGSGGSAVAVPEGGVLVMRPLLLRASSPGAGARPRRVIQIDLSATNLPSPLEWHEAYPLFDA